MSIRFALQPSRVLLIASTRAYWLKSKQQTRSALLNVSCTFSGFLSYRSTVFASGNHCKKSGYASGIHTVTSVFPIWLRYDFHANEDPKASPSGDLCAQITMCSASIISCCNCLASALIQLILSPLLFQEKRMLL